MIKFFKKIIRLIKLGFLEDNLYFINTAGNILPDKLSSSEESELVKTLNDGDDSQKESAKNELIEHNLRLVVYTAQKFTNTGANMEDLVSVGTVGLIKAVGTFNGEKQIKMATYASRCIENEILMFLRKASKTKREVSFDDPLNSDSDGNELKLVDCLGTDGDEVSKDYDKDIEKQMLKKVLSELNDRELLIMKLRYGLNRENDMTQKEVADSLGISQSYISRLEKKILFRLKNEMLKLA